MLLHAHLMRKANNLSTHDSLAMSFQSPNAIQTYESSQINLAEQ